MSAKACSTTHVYMRPRARTRIVLKGTYLLGKESTHCSISEVRKLRGVAYCFWMMTSASAITTECLSQAETGFALRSPLLVCFSIFGVLFVFWLEFLETLGNSCTESVVSFCFCFEFRKRITVFALSKNCGSEQDDKLEKEGKISIYD